MKIYDRIQGRGGVALLNDLNRIFFLQTSQKLKEVCPPINSKVRTKDRDTSHISCTDVIGGRTVEDHTVEVRGVLHHVFLCRLPLLAGGTFVLCDIIDVQSLQVRSVEVRFAGDECTLKLI